MSLAAIDVVYVRVFSGLVLSAVSIAVMRFLFCTKGPSIPSRQHLVTAVAPEIEKSAKNVS